MSQTFACQLEISPPSSAFSGLNSLNLKVKNMNKKWPNSKFELISHLTLLLATFGCSSRYLKGSFTPKRAQESTPSSAIKTPCETVSAINAAMRQNSSGGTVGASLWRKLKFETVIFELESNSPFGAKGKGAPFCWPKMVIICLLFGPAGR